MFTKLTNIIGKIKYTFYGVKLNAQNFILSHIDVQNHARNQSTAASVHRRHDFGRAAAAFLPICVINDVSDKWRIRLCVVIHVKVRNFQYLI